VELSINFFFFLNPSLIEELALLKRENISFIVATNIVATWPGERR